MQYRKTSRRSNDRRQMQLVFSAKRYPEAPGYQLSETSRRAAKEIESEAQTLKAACLVTLMSAARTADEVAELLGQDILSIRPRIAELKRAGKIVDSGLRRANRSGKSAVVWRVTQ